MWIHDFLSLYAIIRNISLPLHKKMRTIFFLSLFLACLISNAQNQKMCQNISESIQVFEIIEKPAEFPGGIDSLFLYLSKNVQYPKFARENDIQGTVFVTFVVEKDGRISNIEILRGIGGGCDEEVVRVIQNMPRWIPGTMQNEYVRQQISLPVKFTLDKPTRHKKNR